MLTLRLATAANVRAFQLLIDALAASNGKWTERLDGDALEDEVGRFRVWAGNLGALQKGHSSLDYRLRDSPNLLSSALKLLNELEHNLNETYAVVSGARLPYEAQTPTNEVEEDENDDGFFSEEDDSDSDEPRNELKMRFEEVVDIIDNLYKLSVRIRTPSIRSRSLKASSYMQTDPETGVDILGAYAKLDRKHVQELLSQLRQSHPTDDQEEQDFLMERLSSSITLRRRHFKYWKRHRDKLGASTVSEETPGPGIFTSHEAPNPVRNDDLEAHPPVPMITTPKPTPSQKTGKTLLSGTEATHHHRSLDDIVDTKSVTSYAVTVKDLNGKGIDLPPPPKAATSDKDFECPYCWIVCPARYGKGRAWKTHLLQDLQPYSCTYQDCENSEQLFRSRREWAEHEATHRKLWRCPEHAAALYNSCSGLENHLRQEHIGSFPEDQIAIIAKIGETTTMDTRTKCPICYAPADTEGLGDLQDHIANHLERFATFALPHGREDDSDGASSVASRGSSNSQSLPESVRTDTSNDMVASEDDLEFEKSSGFADPGQGLLSAENLQQLPDESRNPLAMITDQVEDLDDLEDEQPDDQQLDNDILPAHKEHLDEQEAFRQHILTLPGALSVRFYRRYGSWTGLITFADDWIGDEALTVFDAQRFPNIEFQCKKDTSKWKFSRVSGTNKKDSLFRQSTVDTQTTEDANVISSGSGSYDEEDEESSKQATISVAEIPTLRSLYQSRRLLQRDQSFAPNDAYNQMISFCHYDLTRLRVDAIVNNAPANFKATPTPNSLHHAIFKAGGSGLRKEARSKARVKVGQAELTHGHALPSSWVIHAAAPTYTGSKGVGQFNILSECYRSVLKMAATYELKTIAFPCLGTGGCNFPPRVAARIALQEIREYLDVHPEHRPERIILCVRAAIDEKAYTDFLPVFFPPTHGDLDRARTSDWSANRAALAAQILEARSQLQKALIDMSNPYVFRSQSTACAHDMRRVDSALTSIRNYLLGSKELKRSLGDLNLLCSVVLTACASISEMAERAKEMGFAKEAQFIWDETNTDMQAKHGFDLSTLFDYCWMFANSLDDAITRDMTEPGAMARARQVLENYGVKQKGQDVEGIRDHLDEVIYVRESERPAPNNREIIQVHQIPSVARLYLLGNLEAKPTMAQSSTLFNHTVCLLREDITRLGVDIVVNSTDASFSGMGTLDRSVFKKGGSKLREEVKKFGKCEEGDVKATPGYLLPAKHILHVVPPEQFRKDTKNALRNIYREVLHTAVLMKATSVAIPSIGTGMRNYPRRDCASLAMEEVKRFLESADPGNGLDKIIFVVFSSNDEFIYKSLLPVYFPPPKGNATEGPKHRNMTERIREEQAQGRHQAAMNIDNHMRRETERELREREMRERDARDASLSASVQQLAEAQESLYSSEPLPTNVDASSGSVNEASRSVRFGKQPATSRPMNSDEEHALVQFESHVNDCDICSDGLFERSQELCGQGFPLAQAISRRMEMSEDANVYSKADETSESDKLELPMDLLPSSMLLLSTIAQSIQAGNLDGDPFVHVRRPHTAKPEDQIQRDDNVAYSSVAEDTNVIASATEPPAVIRAAVLDPQKSQDWVCSLLHVYKSKIKIYLEENYPEDHPYATIDLANATSHLTRGAGRDTGNAMSLFVDKMGKSRGKGKAKVKGTLSREAWHFRSAGASDAVALFDVLQRAISRNRKTQKETVSPGMEKATGSASTVAPAAQARNSREISDADSYLQWNQSLRDIKDDLVERRRNEGGIDPQSAAHASNDTASSSGYVTIDYRPAAGRGSLPSQILTYLANDLQTRLGSYIGQNTDVIATAVDVDEELAIDSLQYLVARGEVHNTVDNDTWVISQQINELPALERKEQSKEPSNTDTDAIPDQILLCLGRIGRALSISDLSSELKTPILAVWPAIRQLIAKHLIRSPDGVSWGVTDLGRAKALEIHTKLTGAERNAARDTKSADPNEDPSSDLSERASSYLRSLPGMSENISNLATTFDTPVAELQPVLEQLGSDGLVENKDDGSSWTAKIIQEPPPPPQEVQTEYPVRRGSVYVSDSIKAERRRSADYGKSKADAYAEYAEAKEHEERLAAEANAEAEARARRETRAHEERYRAEVEGTQPRPTATDDANPNATALEQEEQDRMTTKQEQPAAKAPAISQTSSWRDGRGANKRQQTKSNRALAEDIEEDLESGTASSLRLAKIARERKHNKSSRALADDIDDELEYYDGQEEDYVNEDEEPPTRLRRQVRGGPGIAD